MNLREREKRFQYNMGTMTGIAVACGVGMVIGAVFVMPWLVMLALFVVLLLAFTEDYYMDWIRRFFGRSVTAMKLEALANWCGVEFRHVPEHYKCIEVDKK